MPIGKLINSIHRDDSFLSGSSLEISTELVFSQILGRISLITFKLASQGFHLTIRSPHDLPKGLMYTHSTRGTVFVRATVLCI
jgi:hypothetical protein